ncbi:MAG: sulfurtransferase [Chloroflexia bacterium]|nr:sulfurtransferase [Chloroflexia bacterium]
MKNDEVKQARTITRRETFQRGLTLSAGLALGAGIRPTAAQSTPVVTPVAATDFARPQALIDAPTLMTLEGDPARTMLALMPADEFAAGHIAGSVQVDWPAMEITDTSDASVAHWREAMTRLLTGLGASTVRAVVSCDGGSLFATRPWWVLHYLGHTTVHVLNGGLPAWRAAGGEAETGAVATPTASPTATPIANPLAPATLRPEALAPLDEIRTNLDDPNVVLVDARTPEEYAEGHIPGAVNVNYPRNAQPDPPRFWRPQDELRAIYAEVGVTPDKRVIPYCTTGVRSSVTFFSLHLIGYDNVGLYTGSWAEWSSHPDLPITTGNAP